VKHPSPEVNIFLTLRCNFKCAYCATQQGAPDHDYALRRGSEWINGINRLTGVQRLTLTGGLPHLHPDFVEIVNGIALPLERLLIGSNGSKIAVQRLLEIAPKKHLHVQMTYHPTEIGLEEHIAAVKAVAARHTTATHQVGKPVAGVEEAFKDAGLALSWHDRIGPGPDGSFFPEAWRWRADQQPHPPMRCSVWDYPVTAPNGDIYFCHGLMYAQCRRGVLGNICDGWVFEGITGMVCSDIGWCNPCDHGHTLEPL
jgi:hypothetical protein